jgi:L-2,4-diaminobutyrate decarboxylase
MDKLTGLLDTIEQDMKPSAAEPYLRLAARYFDLSRNGEYAKPVARDPESILQALAESPPEAGRSTEEIVAQMERDLLPNSNWLYHPRCLGHQVSAPLPAAVWAEPIIGALNQSLAVREMSPMATVLENRLLRWMTGLAGFGPEAGGVFTSGGTEATFTALLAARAAALPDAWEQGIVAGAVVVTSEHAHYSVARATAELGVGSRNCIALPSAAFRENPERLAAELDRLQAEGRTVMAVVATAGSTATGRFDDLEVVGSLCGGRSIWLHVDGCHGASALLSTQHRGRLKGLDKADSISWDPHKMMFLPLSTGALLIRDERLLEAAFSQRAPYLFHGQATGRAWDQGVRSFQCSRRADVLKLWIALERYGTAAFGTLYDHLCATTSALHDSVRRRPVFEAGPEPECNILCFRYIGDGTMNEVELDALNASMRRRLNGSGQGWITGARLNGRDVLRMTVMNPRTRVSDGEAILDALERDGRECAGAGS